MLAYEIDNQLKYVGNEVYMWEMALVFEKRQKLWKMT